MRKSWIALLLAPCLSFAAYPIYEDNFSGQEVAESDGLQQEIAQESYLQEDAIVYESEEMQGEMVDLPQQPVRKQVPSSQSLRQKRLQKFSQAKERSPLKKQDALVYENEEVEEGLMAGPEESSVQEPVAPTIKKNRIQRSSQASAAQTQKKPASMANKRTPVNKNPSTQSNSQKRAPAQKSRQNPNRPKVTHRSQERDRIQYEAQSEKEMGDISREEEPVLAPKVKKQPSVAKKAALTTQRSNKIMNKGNSNRQKNNRISKSKEKQASTHHSGKRPMSE